MIEAAMIAGASPARSRTAIGARASSARARAQLARDTGARKICAPSRAWP